MGQGGSAGWLLEHGWRVVGVDISGLAARQGRARWSRLMAVIADLDGLVLPERCAGYFIHPPSIWDTHRLCYTPDAMYYVVR